MQMSKPFSAVCLSTCTSDIVANLLWIDNYFRIHDYRYNHRIHAWL